MSVKEDIKSLSEELMKMQILLHKMSEVQQDNLDDLVTRWASNVREMSYDLEDFVDGFLVHSEPDSNRSSFRELTHEMCLLLEKGQSHHRIGNLIKQHIGKQVQDEAKKCKEYNVDSVIADAAATITDTIDTRMLAVFQHQKDLVGIQEPRDDLIKRLSQLDGDVSEQQLKIFSIYGPGGLGKTTLVKAVYDKLKDNFHLMDFASVGQNPDKKQVLRDILDELGNNSNGGTFNEKQLIKELHTLLKNKRYFIVIDDIWDSSAWGIIKYAFPENNLGSRVVTTTRIHYVAVTCCTGSRKNICEMETLNDRDSRRLFVSRIFGMEDACHDVLEDILTIILKKCGGLLLAIISIASLVAKDPSRRSTWDYVRKSLIAMFEGGNPTFTNMERILDLSYRHLSDHLKTCLLHVCMYPEDREIDKNDLLRQWVAEGFIVSTNGRLDAEDVAEKYFKELISMCMIQPGSIDRYTNEVLSCRVHDIILDLMRSKSSEENFIHVVDGSKDKIGAHGEIRRVSVNYNDKEDSAILEKIKGSLLHARSALLYRVSPAPYLVVFKYVRVLHIACAGNLDITGITRLFLLRYLKIKGFLNGSKLPDQIGALQQLKTIDIFGFELKKYPSDIVSLPWLSHLIYCTFRGGGIALPEGVKRMKSRCTLEGIHVHESSVENIKGLGKLTNLRELQIFLQGFRQLDKATTAMRMDALHSSISMLSDSLRILNFGKEVVFHEDCILDVPRGWISRTLFPGGSKIAELNLGCCRFERCPGWISQLHGLYKLTIKVREVADGVSIVAGLPSLAYFCLEIPSDIPEEQQKEESVVIPGGGAFKALKMLMFFCAKASLTFEAGAMPKLKELYFRHHMTGQLLPVGIQHLPAPTLETISLIGVQGPGSREGPGLYGHVDEYRDKLKKDHRKLKAMLERAFKRHQPGADIDIAFRGWNGVSSL